MVRRLVIAIWMLVMLVGIANVPSNETVEAQDEGVLRVLAIDYMGEALENAPIYDKGYEFELTTVDRRDFQSIVVEGRLQEFDLVLGDNQTIDPLVVESGQADLFVSICDILPDLCAPPLLRDLCVRFPWLPMCRFPCPPNGLSCPPILFWDIPIIIDPWPPMEWTIDNLIEIINTETVMVDPRNMVGFYPEPAIFEVTRPTFTTNLEEAYLAFTPACNYVMHYEEFAELGFQPIVVEGYQETPFNVGAYVVGSGNVELAANFASLLLVDTEVQSNIFETTGLLPGNLEVLSEVLPK